MENLQSLGKLSQATGQIEFEWNIDNFFSYTETDILYQSPEFQLSFLRFKLVMCPNGRTTNGSTDYISLYISRVDNKEFSKTVQFIFGIKTVHGDIYNFVRSELQPKFKNSGFPKFILRNTLNEEKLKLLTSGTLTIICALNIKEDMPDTETRKDKLAADLTDMFVSKKNCDLSLKVKQEIFSVHKFILIARSPVFAAMLQTEMSEKESGIVNISDCDPDAFRNFLLYMYSGEIDFSKCRLCDLYIIADKYDVPELKLVCIHCMITSVSVENVCEIYGLGYKFDEIKLMAEAQKFFNRNFKEIVNSDGWMILMVSNCKLANDLLRGMAEDKETNKD